mmetsp:Transcript_30643/g.71433  ORF Transcript_30643/g.71433 Transcript_30643/m.71433 type:complete len:396 (-) Transcript_30643:82-1269(-)
MEPEEVADARVSLLVRTFGKFVPQIQRALLNYERVLFIGQSQRASTVCAHVLAAPLLVSPPLQGLLRRTFPYANLTSLAFLETPAFIAGVTNPMFSCKTGWWDLLCDVDTGKVLRAPVPIPPPNNSVVAEAETAAEVILGSRLVAGVEAQLPEGWVREICRERVRHLIAIGGAALAENEPEIGTPVPEQLASALLVAPSADVRVALRAARRNAGLSRAIRAAAMTAIHPSSLPSSLPSSHGVRAAVERLRGLRGRCSDGRAFAAGGFLAAEGGEGSSLNELGASEACDLLATLLDASRDECALEIFFGSLDATCATGALTPVALLLLYAAPEVRALAARLLQRLETWPQLRLCVRALNPFLVVSYEQQLRTADSAGSAHMVARALCHSHTTQTLG